MQPPRLLYALTLSVIAVAVVASGPLVGAVDLTSAPSETFDPGTGAIELSVEDLPDTVYIRQGEYDSGSYYLEVPDVTADVHSVQGQPMVVYKLTVDELNVVRLTNHFLTSTDAGEQTLSLSRGTLSPDRVEDSGYTGQLRVLTRVNETDTVVRSENVTVVVIER